MQTYYLHFINHFSLAVAEALSNAKPEPTTYKEYAMVGGWGGDLGWWKTNSAMRHF